MKPDVKLTLLFVLLSALLVGVNACGGAAQETKTVTDDLGRNVSVGPVPQRIVSLSPSNTEMLYALGLGDRVVGVDSFSDYPEEAKSKEKVGGFSDTDIEKVVSLQPDLVVASGIHGPTVIPALEKVGLTVVGLEALTVEGMLADLEFLGSITGKEKEAARLVSDLEKRVNAVTDKTDGLSDSGRLRTLYVVWHDPIWAAGSDTLAGDLIAKAGGTNVTADVSGYQIAALEKVVASDPQVMVVITGHGDNKDDSINWARSEPRLEHVSARQTSPSKVFQVDGDTMGRATPRAIDALEELAEIIHPELF